jgi:hypothetical protein
MAEKAILLGHLCGVGLVTFHAYGDIAVSCVMAGCTIQLRMLRYIGFYLLIHYRMTYLTSLGQITAGRNNEG